MVFRRIAADTGARIYAAVRMTDRRFALYVRGDRFFPAVLLEETETALRADRTRMGAVFLMPSRRNKNEEETVGQGKTIPGS